MTTQDNYWLRRRAITRRGVMRSGLAGALGAGAWLVVGCGGDDQPSTPGVPSKATGSSPTLAVGPKSGGNVTIVHPVAEPVLDATLSKDGTEPPLLWLLYDNLVANDTKGLSDASASLAQSWEVVDGTHINFTLRQGVKFHDGTPLNAEAVKFNLDRVLDPATNSVYAAQLGKQTKVTAPGEYTVSLALAVPDAALLAQLGDRLGMIASPTALTKSGADFALHPVASGPFMLDSWVKGSNLTLKRNPNYWRKDKAGISLPYLDSVRINFITDATVALANLESGDAQVVQVPGTDYPRISSSNKYNVASLVGATAWGSYLNNNLAPMNDEHFRKAVAYAIDKKALIAAMGAGQGRESIGPIGPTSWAFNTNLKGYPYGLDAAKKELALSKYPNGVDLPAVVAPIPSYRQEAELWQAMLKPLNINLQVQAGEVAGIIDRMFNKKDVPLFVGGHSFRPDPSGLIGDNLRSDSYYNAGHIENSNLDSLIDKARQTYKVEERKGYYDSIQQIAIDQVWQFIYSFYAVLNIATPKNVQGMEGSFSTDGKAIYNGLWRSS